MPTEPRSYEVEEILSRTPSWLMRWGISMLFFIVIMFLFVAQLIKYPDIINASITISTEQPPISVIAQSSGKLNQLLVSDKQTVKKDEILAVIENTANYKHVLQLKTLIEKWVLLAKQSQSKGLLFDGYGSLVFPDTLQLGDLQPAYALFTKSQTEFNTFLKLHLHAAKIQAAQNQLIVQEQYYQRVEQQKDILEQELSLGEKRFKADSSLFKEQVIAMADYDKSKAELLQKRYGFQGARSSLIQIKMQKADLEQKIVELDADFKQTNNKLQTDLNKAAEALQAQIISYELHYIIKAPIDGNVAFTGFWAINQPVKGGDEVLVVTPKNTGKLFGRLEIPIEGSSKVIEGQSVNIKLTGYPYQEYGMLSGKIASVATIGNDKMIRANVALVNGTITTYNKILDFSNKANSLGTAEIITKKRTVLERIFDKFYSLIKRG